MVFPSNFVLLFVYPPTHNVRCSYTERTWYSSSSLVHQSWTATGLWLERTQIIKIIDFSLLFLLPLNCIIISGLAFSFNKHFKFRNVQFIFKVQFHETVNSSFLFSESSILLQFCPVNCFVTKKDKTSIKLNVCLRSAINMERAERGSHFRDNHHEIYSPCPFCDVLFCNSS